MATSYTPKQHGTTVIKRKLLPLNLALSSEERSMLLDALEIAQRSCKETAEKQDTRGLKDSAEWFMRYVHRIAGLRERIQ